jgi:hypothetical protein
MSPVVEVEVDCVELVLELAFGVGCRLSSQPLSVNAAKQTLVPKIHALVHFISEFSPFA